MARFRPDERAERLLHPVRAIVDRGLSLLPDAPLLEVRVGAVTGVYDVDDGVVVLSEALDEEGATHVHETGPLPLDRWRRAAASVLEAASLLELAKRTHLPIGDDWRWRGAAVFAADAVAPELGVAWPETAAAIATGDLTAFPRAGVAILKAWQARKVDPMRQARYLLDGGVVSPAEWLALARWVVDPTGAGSHLPVHVERPAPVAPPAVLPPWSWKAVAVGPLPYGGRLVVSPGGEVEEPWIAAGTETRVWCGATAEPVSITLESGAPVGTWEVASAEGFGQVMGARGVGFTFGAEGNLEIVLADAFVGPLAAVAMSGEVGTSGVCTGRWQVAGAHLLRLSDIATGSLTLHGRTRDRFLVPARGFGLGQWLHALADEPWAWQVAQERLVLRGRMQGGEVEVRLRRG